MIFRFNKMNLQLSEGGIKSDEERESGRKVYLRKVIIDYKKENLIFAITKQQQEPCSCLRR